MAARIPHRRALRPTPASLAVVCALTAAGGCGEAPAPDRTDILIVGTEHLAQREEPRPAPEVEPVVDSLRPYAPDMVVVEYLPPEWPEGEGRDYRWTFDDDAYAREWGIPRDSAPARLAALLATVDDVPYGALPEPQRCELARLHFLARDRANALYYWLDADCPAEADSLLTRWIAHRGRHEMARVAFPLARAGGLHGVVSFDYQGDDARWSLGDSLFAAVRDSGSAAQRRELDSLVTAIQTFRARNDSIEGSTYMASVRYRNSARWLALQHRLYEEVLPILTYGDSAGRRQTARYWLRNERMFDRIDDAAAREDPDRILVVVGAGHKYFLDELAVRRGYRWIDPLGFLGTGQPLQAGSTDAGASSAIR